MNIHQNARLTPKGRALLVRRIRDGQTVQAAAAACGVSTRTAYRWLRRYRNEGQAGLRDRSSRPHRSPRRTPKPVFARVIVLRRQRWTGRRIAAHLGVSAATISRVLRRAGLQRLADLEPAPPVQRYEHPRPGICCISTSKSSAVLSRPVIVSPPTGPNAVAAPAGSSFTWPLTTTLAWRSRRSCPMSAAARRWRFYGPPSPTTVCSVYVFAVCSPTTVLVIAPTPSERRVGVLASVSASLDPTRPAPMARPSASSRPCASGPMLVPITHPSNAPRIFRTGFMTTLAPSACQPRGSRLPLPLNNLLSLHT